MTNVHLQRTCVQHEQVPSDRPFGLASQVDRRIFSFLKTQRRVS